MRKAFDYLNRKFKEWLNPEIVQMRRQPLFQILYPHQLGLTIGLLFSLFNLWELTKLSGLEDLGFVFVFLLGTFIGGPFLTALAIFVCIIAFPGIPPKPYDTMTIFSSFEPATEGYLLGYVSGAFFSYLYNSTVLFYFNSFSCQVRIAFAFYSEKALNIIKSPISQEEKAFNELVKRNPRLREKRLYQFQYIDPKPLYPYTIVFVANPYMSKKYGVAKNKLVTRPGAVDPIYRDKALFYKTVDKALRSFEANEVLGRPEIWSRIRIITLFPKPSDAKKCLVEGIDGLSIDGEIVANVLSPKPGMAGNIRKMMSSAQQNLPAEERIPLEEVDVIFALSANPYFTRSSSMFSDAPTSEDEKTSEFCKRCETQMTSKVKKWHHGSVTGEVYNLSSGHTFPEAGTARKVVKKSGEPTESLPILSEIREGFEHEYYACIPGRVALNVLTATSKTFVHEFAHAMSSVINGAIGDEYADNIELPREKNATSSGKAAINGNKPVFYVNKLKKETPEDGRSFMMTPKVFLRYHDTVYFSDLEHPSANANWLHYFPERFSQYVPCTMDRSNRHFRFDKLISAFMYNRLAVKINRTEKWYKCRKEPPEVS